MAGMVTETDVVRKVLASRLPAGSIGAGAVTNDPLVQQDAEPVHQHHRPWHVKREDRPVSLVYLVCLVCLLEPERPDRRDKPDQPSPSRSSRQSRATIPRECSPVVSPGRPLDVLGCEPGFPAAYEASSPCLWNPTPVIDRTWLLSTALTPRNLSASHRFVRT